MQDPPHPATPSRAARAAALVLLLIAAGCSDSPSGADAVDADASGGPSLAVESVGLQARDVWGAGRAVLADAGADGSLVAVTTRGVERIDTAGDTAVLDELTGVQPRAVAIAPDGASVAVGLSAPPSIRIYRAGSGGAWEAVEYPLDAPVRAIEFVGDRLIIDTPLGPFAATAGSAPTPVAPDPVSGVSAVLPDGTVVAGIAATAELAVVSPQGTVARQAVPVAQDATVLDVRSSPDGSLLAVTSGVGANLFERQDRITILDAATFAVLGTVEPGVALDPVQWTVTDGALFISLDGVLQAFAPDGTAIVVHAAVDSSVSALVAVPDGLVSVHADGTLVVWSGDLQNPTVLGSGVPLESVGVTDDGASIVTVDRYGAITVRRASDGAPERVEERFAIGDLTDVAVASDGRLGVVSTLGVVTVLDSALAEQQTYAVTDEPALIDAVSFDPSAGTVVAGVAERLSETSFDDTVRAWDLESGTERFRTGGEAEDVAGCSFFYGRVRFSPDGRFVAITSHDFSVQVVDVATGAVAQVLPGETTVLDLAFTQDGAQLVATYDDGMVRVWRTSDYGLDASYRGAQGGYFAIAMLPGATMAAADITGAITLLDIETGGLVGALDGAMNRTSDLAVSPDGSLIAAPTADGGVSVWSAAGGPPIATAQGHTAAVTGIAFAPTGDWIATSSTDGTVRTWSIDA